MRGSVRWPLTLALLGSALAALGLGGFYLFASVRASFLETLEANLRSHAESISALMESHMDEVALTPAARRRIFGEMVRLSEQLNARLCLVNWRGDVLEDSAPDGRTNVRDLPEVYEALNGRYGRSVRDGRLFVAVPMRAKGQLVGAVYASRPLGELAQLLEELRQRLLVAAGWAALCSLLLSVALGRFLTLPLGRLAQGVERISQGDYSHRLELSRRDELGALGRDIDQMAGRLEEHRRVLMQFVSDASHELKTPIASLRALAEALSDGGLEDAEVGPRFVGLISEEVARMERLVQDLLTLQRSELRRSSFRLRELVEELGVEVEVEPGLVVWADRLRLRQVLTNLVANAWAAGATRVTVGAEVGDVGVVVRVADDGRGIPAEARERVFERFYRVEQDRARDGGGSGLGLAICRQLVEAHGGEIGVESRVGEGSVFWFRLPQPERGVAEG